MSTVGRLNALIKNAEGLERRAENGEKIHLEEIAKAYGEATELSEKHLGNLSEQTLNLRERWADSVRNTGNLTKATTCHLRNVEWTLENLKQQQRQHSSRDSIAYAQERHLYAQRQLAETHLENGKFSEAISVYEDILNSNANRSLEEFYRDRADLAAALFSSGSDRNIMKAVNLNVETLQKADQNLGRSHAETVRIRYNLAKELYSLKKYGDASKTFEELLRILEAEGCQARSSPDYHSNLEDTKTSLRNCSKQIARQQEEWRKAEKVRRGLQDQLNEKRPVAREGNGAGASAYRTDKNNQHDKPRKAEPPKVQENQKSQFSDVSKQSKQPSGTTDRQKKQEKPGRETRHQVSETSSQAKQQEKPGRETRQQVSETSSQTKQQEKPSDSKREEKENSTYPKKQNTVESPSEHQSSAKRKADRTKDISVPILELHLTNQSSSGSQKQTSKFEAVINYPLVKDVPKFPIKPEAKRNLPIRPHSAAGTLSPHSTNESGPKKVQRSNSTQSDVSRSKRSKGHNDELEAFKNLAVNKKSTRQRESAPSAPRNTGTQQEKSDSKSKAQPGENHSRSASTPITQSADRQSRSDVTNWVVDTSSPSTSKAREAMRKEKKDKGESSHNNERPDEHTSRISSAPSIVLSELGHRKETQSSDGTKSRHRSQHERERPRSSQSHYREASSPLDIVNMDIAKRKESRSRSSDSKRVSMPPKTEDDLEASKDKPNAGKSTSRGTLLLSGNGTKIPPPQSSEKCQRKQTEEKNGDMAEPSGRVVTEKSASNSKLAPVKENIQQPYIWTDAREYLDSANQGNEDIQRLLKAVEPSQFSSALSGAKHNQNEPLEAVAPPDPVPVISTGALNTGRAEHMIPGGWHQDFDEPDLNQKLRKSRSNDALSQGGLRVSQPSDAGHRRAASVDIPRPIPTPKRAPHIKDWSYIDEIKADEWLDRLQKKTHAFLDKYRDDCYGVAKSARRVRIAVLDTGVAKSTAKGPVPSLMKGPRVKIGKMLDPSLPWNMDTRGHGTHAAGLILTVCPYADLYVYRVCDGNSHIDKKLVADAILHAVDEKKVDIISMSLGWEDNSDDELENALQHARRRSVLIFAASSNEGLRTKAGMAFPARALEVIAIDAADVNGRPLGSNPSGTNQRGGRLTALGQAVLSTWPLDLPTEEPETGWKRLAGTSCATPIAAGIAGLVLEFARQRPMCYEQKIEQYLKKIEGMHLTLRYLLSVQCDTDSRFRDLDPTKLFYAKGDDNDRRDWARPLTPRSNAASRIVEVLWNEYGDDIGLTMSQEMAKEMGRRHGEGEL